MTQRISITDFHPNHQPGIDLLLDNIQQEYPESIYGPGSKKLADAALLPGRRYWVALDQNMVVGTIGVVILNNNNGCLKSMMLHRDYRGSNFQIANTLLKVAISYAVQKQTEQMFLGTMSQFKAARSFYRKHGFSEIQETELPADFMKNPVDTIFFKLTI